MYPVINLKHFKPSVRWYVTQIENTVIKVCENFGLKAETSPYTGVWIGDKKVKRSNIQYTLCETIFLRYVPLVFMAVALL